MKVRPGPVLCDGGAGSHAALIPWRWRGKVLCPNCLLRALSDAIRAGEPLDAEQLDAEEPQEQKVRARARRGEVVRMRRVGGQKQLDLFRRGLIRTLELEGDDEA